jgi:hypothetical protein
MDPASGATLVDALGRRSYTTSIAYGPTLGKNIALAYLPQAYCEVGRELQIQYFGDVYPVEVAAVGYRPLYDAENAKPRSALQSVGWPQVKLVPDGRRDNGLASGCDGALHGLRLRRELQDGTQCNSGVTETRPSSVRSSAACVRSPNVPSHPPGSHPADEPAHRHPRPGAP